jgi:hypothetical protein
VRALQGFLPLTILINKGVDDHIDKEQMYVWNPLLLLRMMDDYGSSKPLDAYI